MRGLRAAMVSGVVLTTALVGAGAAAARSTPPAAAAASVPAVVSQLAPWVWLYKGDVDKPDSTSNFIHYASLKWWHDDGCQPDTITGVGDVVQAQLGDGRYSGEQDESPYVAPNKVFPASGCAKGGAKYNTEELTRPGQKGNVSGGEGYYLDENTSYQDGIGTSAPMYYQYVPDSYVTYWFFYGNNNSPSLTIGDHQGDWEAISIELNSSNKPVRTAYFEHSGACTLSWNNTPKSQGRPVTFSAKGTHADYPTAGSHSVDEPVVGGGVFYDHTNKGPLWNAQGNLVDVTTSPWYGYGGAWGNADTGAMGVGSEVGPLGPSKWKSPTPASWTESPCQLNTDRTDAEAITPSTATADGGFENAFQAAGEGTLWTSEPTGTAGDWGNWMAPGTSPSIAPAPGGYDVAFQDDNGDLTIVGAGGEVDTGLGMMRGTSPSIHEMLNGGYEVAFQANTGDLWVYGSLGTGDLGYGMAANTSPSITAIGNSYEIAFDANTWHLWTVGTAGTSDTGLGISPATSPSITGLWTGGYEVAFNAFETNDLWTTGADGTKDWPTGLDPNSSPSITVASGGYEVALQTNTHDLWTLGTDGYNDWQLGMMPGSSPAIASVSGGQTAFEVTIQANNGNLWNAGADGTGGNIYGLAPGTNPAIAGS